jgi:hypothetical protein
MAGEKPGGSGGRRPVPTIDLTASEVASEPPHTTESVRSDSTGQTEENAQPEQQNSEQVQSGEDDGRPTNGSGWKQVLASLGAALPIGAILLLVLVGAWVSYISSAREHALAAKLAAIEAQLRELAAGRAPPNADGKFEELAARIARIEAAPARPAAADSGLAGRVAAAESATRSLADSIASLKNRIEEVATTAREARSRADATAPRTPESAAVDQRELDALANRIGAVEQTARAMQGELAKPTVDHAVRRVLVASALKAAVERGEPFAAELAAAKPLAADRLAPLEPFARSGVPSVQALTRELLGLVPSMLPTAASKPREASGLLERLQVERFVRIRPVGEAVGDDPAAIVARVESRATQADVAGALAELRKLPVDLRAPAETWIRKVEARDAAVELSRKFAAEAMDALGKF